MACAGPLRPAATIRCKPTCRDMQIQGLSAQWESLPSHQRCKRSRTAGHTSGVSLGSSIVLCFLPLRVLLLSLPQLPCFAQVQAGGHSTIDGRKGSKQIPAFCLFPCDIHAVSVWIKSHRCLPSASRAESRASASTSIAKVRASWPVACCRTCWT